MTRTGRQPRIGLIIAIAAVGCSREPPTAAAPVCLTVETATACADHFRDVTSDSGIDFAYRNGEEADQYAMIEVMGGGLAAIDYDGDGLLDLFVVGGGTFEGPNRRRLIGRPCKLYRNLGGFKFRDVTDEVGLGGIDFYSHGAFVADYDRDGWPDLLVTGWKKLALFHNEPVDPNDPSKGRKFVNVTKAVGLPDGLWTTGAAFGDLDGDGYPDLYLAQYADWSFEHNHPTDCKAPDGKRDVCAPKRFSGLEHRLFRNVDGRRFEDGSRPAGLVVYELRPRDARPLPQRMPTGAGVLRPLIGQGGDRRREPPDRRLGDRVHRPGLARAARPGSRRRGCVPQLARHPLRPAPVVVRQPRGRHLSRRDSARRAVLPHPSPRPRHGPRRLRQRRDRKS